MNIGAVLIGIAILVIGVPYVINPIVNQRKKPAAEAISPKKNGENQQKNTLAAIRDLDFDFHTGKIALEDYESVRHQLIAEAAEHLRMKQEENEKIEAMIRLRSESGRAQVVKTAIHCDQCGGEIHPQDDFCPKCGVHVKKQAGTEEPTGQAFCPNCGNRVKAHDRYCMKCGYQLSDRSTVVVKATVNN